MSFALIFPYATRGTGTYPVTLGNKVVTPDAGQESDQDRKSGLVYPTRRRR